MDLDFYALTETCITGDMKLVVKKNGTRDIPVEISACDLDYYLNDVPVDTWVNPKAMYVWSNGGFKKIKGIVRHNSETKRVLEIHSLGATIKVTEDHLVSIKDEKGKIHDVLAKDLMVGQSLVKDIYIDENIIYADYDESSYIIDSITDVEYQGYVYDLEVSNHHFMINGVLVHNCLQIPLDKLFKGGFSTGHGYLREPESIRSYAALTAIALQCNQNEMHGGQSIPALDYYLAPGVCKSYISEICRVLDDKYDISDEMKSELKKELRSHCEELNYHFMSDKGSEVIKSVLNSKGFDDEQIENAKTKALKYTEKETYQAMEALVHNLNSMHSRAGAQVPFTSVNFGTDTSEEGRMVSRNLLLSTESGLGAGETAIFPISIFKVKEGVNYNPEDPNYDLFKLSIRVSAKRLFPTYEFIDAPFNLQYYKAGDFRTELATMGCRTRVIGNVYDPTREIVTGRGNLSFTSINLPRLGIEAHGDIDKFFELLDEKMYLVKRQLTKRFKLQCSKHVYNYPFLMGQGLWLDSDKLGPNDTLEDILPHGSLSLGFLGLAECLVALIGEHHGQSDKAQELGLKIIGHMRELTDMWQKEEYINSKGKGIHLNWSILGTPKKWAPILYKVA